MNTPVFADSEQMRILLYDLTYSPGGGWRTDPRATDLMRFAMDKYAGLARKYGLEPGEAAVAAFEVMRMRSTRLADDPWAVITRAVELTLIYESRAAGLLCSSGSATARPRSRTTTRRFTAGTTSMPWRSRRGSTRTGSRPTRWSPWTWRWSSSSSWAGRRPPLAWPWSTLRRG